MSKQTHQEPQGNPWDSPQVSREASMEAERRGINRDDIRAAIGFLDKGKLALPRGFTPRDQVYVWVAERFLNQDCYSEIEKAWRKGYRFVKYSDDPTAMQDVRDMEYGRFGDDDRIRTCGMMLMKMDKPRHDIMLDCYNEDAHVTRAHANSLAGADKNLRNKLAPDRENQSGYDANLDSQYNYRKAGY